ncbi:uncharacterized protein K02A2.6-like [Tigriopus californicus]|uniref:uncharacterized protein K02A2.6-like n=1 Tax=Tigriopus californicus TaxID=6832 RepID=UPI0027DA69C3|nr:uncharacterized protein K02A2.6-like [Tigriopus californicus]
MIVQDQANDFPVGPEDTSASQATQDQLHKSYRMPDEQARDPALHIAKDWVQKKKLPDMSNITDPQLRRYATLYPKLRLTSDGTLFLEEGTGDDQRLRLCVPAALIAEVIRCLHQHPLAGHLGRYRTYLQAKRRFYWPNMHKHISCAVEGCTTCRQSKERKATKQVPLGQTSTKEHTRFAKFYCDLVGPWPNARGPGTKKYLLTLQDAVTKYPEAWAITDATAENIIRVLTNEFFPRYGVGMTIVSDQGRQFISTLFQHAVKRLGVFTVKTQAYEPKTNPVERLHRTLENVIRCSMENEKVHPTQWH